MKRAGALAAYTGETHRDAFESHSAADRLQSQIALIDDVKTPAVAGEAVAAADTNLFARLMTHQTAAASGGASPNRMRPVEDEVDGPARFFVVLAEAHA